MRDTREIIEERNDVLKAMKRISQKAITENRGFNEAENKQALFLKQRSIELEQELKEAKQELRTGATIITEDKGEKRMITKEELRAAEEIRTITTATHETSIPTNTSEKIILALTENSQILGDADCIEYSGKFQLNREDEVSEAMMLDEVEQITETPVTSLTPLILQDKRCGSLVKISEILLNSAPQLGIKYLSNVLGRRISRTLDSQIFYNEGRQKDFSGSIFNDGKKFETDELTIDSLVDMAGDMQQRYLSGAKWYMNRELFKQVQKMKNANGDFYVIPNVKADGLSYTLLGMEIIISEFATKVCLINPFEAILVKLNPEAFNVRVLKETYALSGEIGMLVNILIDGGIKNPEAIRVMEIATKAKSR